MLIVENNTQTFFRKENKNVIKNLLKKIKIFMNIIHTHTMSITKMWTKFSFQVFFLLLILNVCALFLSFQNNYNLFVVKLTKTT